MNKEIQKSPSSPAAKKKISTVMDEYKGGKLKSGSGKKVKDRDQAMAIALSESREALQRKYGGKGITMYKDSVNSRFQKGKVTMPKKTAKEDMLDRMMEDPRNPGAFLRNSSREFRNLPQYTKKELRMIREAEQLEMDRKFQEAYERVSGRKIPRGD